MPPPTRQDYAPAGPKESNPVKIDFQHRPTPPDVDSACLPIATAQADIASGPAAAWRRGAALPALRQAVDRARAGSTLRTELHPLAAHSDRRILQRTASAEAVTRTSCAVRRRHHPQIPKHRLNRKAGPIAERGSGPATSLLRWTTRGSDEPAARRAGRFWIDPAKQDRGLPWARDLVPRHGQVADRACPL
jgi:hypothetical protein